MTPQSRSISGPSHQRAVSVDVSRLLIFCSCDPVAGPQLKAGQTVKAKLVADPKGKGRPFAEHAGLVGNILNPGDLPGGLEIGNEVSLEIANVNVAAKQIAFRYKK